MTESERVTVKAAQKMVDPPPMRSYSAPSMTPEQIRLEALKLAIPPGISNPDTKLILDRAQKYEDYIVGTAEKAPRAKRTSAKAEAELPTGA